MSYDYDLFVIGAGSGGVRASRIAAQLGAKVVVAEELYLGGTCVNVGCVPKKLFVYASQFSEERASAAGFGWQTSPTEFHWPTLRDNKTGEIERLNSVYGRMLDNAGVTVIDGRAKIVDAHHVEVKGKQYSADRILVAVGGWPILPDIPGKEHIISSNEVFYLDTFPKRALVLGGGYISVEFAGIFNGLGSDTHLIYRSDLFLRGFDTEIREFVAQEMTKKGVSLHFNRTLSSVEKQADGSLLVTLSDDSTLETDMIMAAIGRQPKTQDLGLENTKVQLSERGAIQVSDDFQTAEPSIYAVGDVIDRVQLTPVALAEGMALARNLYGKGKQQVDYSYIATAVFSQPNIGTVGYSEEEAKAQFKQVAVYKSEFCAMKNTLGGSEERTLMKLLVDQNSDRVIGCHMVGPDAGEIIQGLAVAIKAGATKADFDSTIGIHPTAAEEFVTMREPAYVLGQLS